MNNLIKLLLWVGTAVVILTYLNNYQLEKKEEERKKFQESLYEQIWVRKDQRIQCDNQWSIEFKELEEGKGYTCKVPKHMITP